MLAMALVFTGQELRGSDACHEGKHKCINENLWQTLREGNKKFIDNPKYAKQRKPLVHG